MTVIEERYIQINLWCRPLRKSVYSFSDMRKKKIEPSESATTSLILRMREKERREIEASGILERRTRAATEDEGYKEYTSALSMASESYVAFEEREIAPSPALSPLTTEEALDAIDAEAQIKTPRLRRLRARVDNALFDYSEIEQEKIEKEVDELVNADGYYNELEPIDVDVDYQRPSVVTPTLVLAILGFTAYVIFILFF